MIGQGKNAKICYYPGKKKRVELYAASHSEIKFDQMGGEVEDRASNIINIKLEMGGPAGLQGASKTRTRFMSKPKILTREGNKGYTAPEKKPSVENVQVKQNSYLNIDAFQNNFLHFEPIKK